MAEPVRIPLESGWTRECLGGRASEGRGEGLRGVGTGEARWEESVRSGVPRRGLRVLDVVVVV